ncbi:MAG: hypothetical protein CMP10_08100 [Zetaproteobacteria bacterium]|nr:hypothetical protein [Pseudobdellovibrionaceae bacterium]
MTTKSLVCSIICGWFSFIQGCNTKEVHNYRQARSGAIAESPNTNDLNKSGAIAEGSNENKEEGEPVVGLNAAMIDSLCQVSNDPQIQFNIVGGQDANISDMVTKSTIRLNLGGGICTGTIIGPNHISTASHCLEVINDPSEITIEWGTTPRAAPGISVSAFAMHPRYGNSSALFHDIGIITFDGEIPEGYGIAPVGNTKNLSAGTIVTLAGFGRTFDEDNANRPLRFVEKSATFNPSLKELQLDIGGGMGGCNGDSGGPSYIEDPDRPGCLRTLSATKGPGRASNGTCNQGSGTLIDITLYQGWMRCNFEKMGRPLTYILEKDTSEVDCDATQIIAN